MAGYMTSEEGEKYKSTTVTLLVLMAVALTLAVIQTVAIYG